MLKNYTCRGVADKRSRKELKACQKSYKLCLEIYRITAKFPNEEGQQSITLGTFTYLMA